MFGNQFNNLEEFARANHHRFVHPADPQPAWVLRAAKNRQALDEIRAEAREERRNRQPVERLGFLRRLRVLGRA